MSCRYVVPILSLFVSLFAAPSPFAAKNPNPVSRVPAKERVVYRDVWRTPEIVSGQIATESGRAPLQAAYDFFASRSESYHIDNPESELELIKDRTDQLGFHHLRFQQRFDGLDIWGCQTIVHFSAEGKVYLVAGQSVPTPQISTIPDRSSEEAAQIAADKVRNQLPKGETQTEAELVIYPQNGTTYLCWEVTVTHATRRDIRWKVFVNALTGDVEFFFNDIKSDGPTIGFGKDTRDSIRTIQTYQLYGNYRLLDAARSMYVPPIESRTGIVGTWFHEAGAAFDAVGDPNNNNIFDDNDSVKAAVAGHYYAGQTYEYFKSTFGWNSWDGNGGSISIAVYDPNTMNNAFALGGGFCVFGRGDYTYYLPWSGSLDVVAHEITHNITAVTGGLFYAYQSGALNESYSDFFGAMVDRDDWLIAEEIALWPDGRLRSMSDPADGADPDLYSFGYQPSHMDDFVITDILNDNGGVHINSGIPNHVGYLVANDIGRDKTEQIWWRTLTTYLTPNSHFYFWGEMTIQAAVDLYGEGSPEEASVRAALDVVGIGLLYPEPTVMANIPVLIGEATDTSFIVLNAEVSDTIDLLTITNYSPIVTVTSTIPETLEGRDTVTVDLHIDATALTSCDIGSVLDTIIITTSSDKTPTISVPVNVNIGLTSAERKEAWVSSECFRIVADNVDRVRSGYSLDGSISGLFDGSPMIGYVDGADTIVYHSQGDAIYPFTPIENFSGYTTANGYQTWKVHLASPNARIQGEAHYYAKNKDIEECRYILANYKFYNPCDTQLTVLTGMLTDLDVFDAYDNIVRYSVEHNLIYARDHNDQYAMGIALLRGDARNFVALRNSQFIYPNGTLLPNEAYKQMAREINLDGLTWDDWSTLLTFGFDTLGVDDTLSYDIAFIFSDEGEDGLYPILDAIIPASDSGDLNVQPLHIDAFVAEESPTNPLDAQLTVSYIGTLAVSWEATHTAAWSIITPTSGTTDDQITYTYNALSLPPGTYVDTVTVNSPELEDFDRRTFITLDVIAGDGITDVPTDYATIQAAIAASPSGEIIRVTPGTYTENFDLQGKNLQIVSTDGPELTTLQPADPNLPLVSVVNGEGGTAKVSGFTMTGTCTDRLISIGNESEVLIENNIFTGIETHYIIVANSSNPTIRNNLFVNNPQSYLMIFIEGNGDATIENNTLVGGGGVDWGISSDAASNTATIRNNIITRFKFGLWDYNLTELSCNDVWGNEINYAVLVLPEFQESDPGGTNISENPLYCDPGSGDYLLYSISPCAPGNSPCGALIGARPAACEIVCGDASNDGAANISDAVHIIDWIFKGGAAPNAPPAADANCDGQNNISDAVHIINWVFKGGDPPCCP